MVHKKIISTFKFKKMFRRCLIYYMNTLKYTGRTQHLNQNTIRTVNFIVNDNRFSKVFSTDEAKYIEFIKSVEFNDVKRLTTDKNALIIDVREPEELVESGVIPGSINIPLDQVETTLKTMTNEQFTRKFGRFKPQENDLVVFSCQKGRRSELASITALQLGYKNVNNYLGGWMDWTEKNQK